MSFLRITRSLCGRVSSFCAGMSCLASDTKYILKETTYGMLEGIAYGFVFVAPVAFEVRDYLFSRKMEELDHACPLRFPIGFTCDASPEYGDDAYNTTTTLVGIASLGLIASIGLINAGASCLRARRVNAYSVEMSATLQEPLLDEPLAPMSLVRSGLWEGAKTLAESILLADLTYFDVKELLTSLNTHQHPSIDAAFRQAEIDTYKYFKIAAPWCMAGMTLFGGIAGVKKAIKFNRQLAEAGEYQAAEQKIEFRR